jgi:type IV pilus assembly protein PilW
MIASVYPYKRPPQSGLTLVELLVAMTIGGLLMLALFNLFQGTRLTYRMTEQTVQLQDNGRLAQDYLSRHIRHAGFKERCPNEHFTNLLATDDEHYHAIIYDLTQPLSGWDGLAAGEDPVFADVTLPAYQPETDVLLIRHAALSSGLILGDLSTDRTELTVTGASSQHALYLLVDDWSCHLFQNEASDSAGIVSIQQGDTSIPGNDDAAQLPGLSATAELLKVYSSFYFIAPSQQHNIPSLWVCDYGYRGYCAEPWELIEGVFDMQIQYGLDSNGDGQLESYQSASAVTNWRQVRAVRIALLLGAVTTGNTNPIQADDAGMALPFITNAGDSFVAQSGDKRLYRTMYTTIALRNLP